MSKLFTTLRATAIAAAIATAPSLFAQEALPYAITFTQSNLSTWSLLDLDNNGDNWGALKWGWFNGLRFNLTSKAASATDDWAISPAFALEAGTQYEMTYYFYADSGSAKYIPLDVRLVTSNSAPENEGELIAEIPAGGEWTTSKTGDSYAVTFTPSKSGTYYIGFHLTAPYLGYDSSRVPKERSGKFFFRDFGLKALQKAIAPGAITASMTPADKGAEKVNLSVTLPSVNAEGNALTSNLHYEVYREDDATPVYTSPDLAPGASHSATVDAYPGETWMRVVAVNDAGPGLETRLEGYVGVDVPTAVTALGAKIGSDGKMTVSWTAPATTVHGGYLDFSTVSYQVSRVLDGELKSLGNVNGNSFTDESLGSDKQVNVSYQVVGRSSAGLGASAQSATVNYGPTLALPFAESFANKSYHTTPWHQETVNNFEDANYQPEWTLIESATVTDNVTDDNPEGDEIPITSQDTDKGFLRFNSNAIGKSKEAASGRLCFPAINFSDKLNPVLTFYMMRETYYTTNPATNGGYRDDYVTVEIACDNGGFQPVEGAEFHRYGNDNDWVLCEVPLYQGAGKSRVQVAIRGFGFGGGPIYIDNINIKEGTAYDLQAVSLTGPKRVRVAENGTFQAAVKNAGGSAVDSYTVELLKDGKKVADVNGAALKPGEIKVLTLTFTPTADDETAEAEFTAKAVYPLDQDQSNNVSEAVKTAVTAALLPAVSKINGENVSGTIKLSWSNPDYLPAETLVEEDGFESYEPFAINSFGDFTTYDLDGRITFGIGAAAGVQYPNSGEKIAYQIFAPTLTNIDEEELGLWATHSGQNMAIAPQAAGGVDPVASNDWLVFPRLSGNEQTIRFWARSFSDTYSEFIQGFYTNTANPTEADDFLPCPDGGNVSYAVPAVWTELQYSVPAGAKYFALRHTSADGYALMVDDVTYQRSIPDAKESGLIGYNVYCNGELLNDKPVADKSYSHVNEKSGDFEYSVAAVYPAGESTKSEVFKVSLIQQGVDGIDNSFGVAVNGLELTVSGAEGKTASLYTPAGVKVASAVCGEETTIQAPSAGIYLLTVGSKTMKVAVR